MLSRIRISGEGNGGWERPDSELAPLQVLQEKPE